MKRFPCSRLIRAWALLLVSLVALTNGCGDSQNFVFTGTANNPGPVVGNTLTVNLDTSAVQARISGDAVAFEVTLYDEGLTELDSVTVARGQSASFENLADGTYTIRVIGLDGNGDVVGYFDRRLTIGDNTSVTIAGLIYTNTVPPLGSNSQPFLVLTELPDAITGGDDFLIQATAFDTDGSVLLTYNGAATIEASPLDLSGVTTANFSNGVANFPGLLFDQGSEGNVVLTVTSAGLSATSPAIPVVAGPPVGTPHLVFTTVPSTGTAGQELTPAIQVQLRDENDDPVTDDGVAVTLSLESFPEGAAIAGDSTVETVDGVATFSGVSVSPAGDYVFEATAPDYDPAVSSQVEVAAPPFTKLAVGDYTADRIFIYSLADLAATGNTDVAPLATIGTNTATDSNYDLDSADGGDALWFCDGNDLVKLFTDINDGDDGQNNDPAKTFTYANSIASVSYDEGRDILFSASYDDDPGSVQIWDGAFALADGSTPTRALTNFPGYATYALVDDASNRLFVFCATATDDEFELHVFANASTVAGDQTLITHDVCTVTFPTDGEPFGLSYDAANDRLWAGDYNGTATDFYFLDGVSDLGATATISTVSDGGADPWFWDTFYDAITDTLYVSDYFNSTNGRICIFENASEIEGAMSTVNPTRTLGGVNSLLQGPDGITLLP